jgi:nucleoside-diphosphate-sugar epimerase
LESLGVDMKVLVTGSEGYIGAVMVPFLQRAGHEVVGLDACFLAHRRFLGDLAHYELMRGDIRDVTVEQLKGFDAICHLAAISNDPIGELNPDITEDINYKGTISLAKKAKEGGVSRFLFSSSCSIYGAGDTGQNLSEEAQFHPLTAYARSKVSSESDLRELADDNFSPVYLRNATAFGMSPRLRLDLVVNNLTAWAHTTGEIAMTSDGTPWRPLVHIRDISLAFQCALEAPRELIYNQAFNVGRSDANYQIRDIAHCVGELMPKAKITFGEEPGRGQDQRTYRVSFEKAEKQLPGFQPQMTVQDGVREALEQYQAFGLTEEHLNSLDFITLNRYKELLQQNKLREDFRWK